MSNLIGTTPTIKVACIANFEENGKKIPVKFTAVYERLTRQSHKALQKRLQEMLRQLREVAKKVMVLEEKDDLTDDDIAQRNSLDEELNKLQNIINTEIKGHLKAIENLKGADGSLLDYSEELVDDMLNYEPYFVALRDGLYKSTGVYEEQKTKNS